MATETDGEVDELLPRIEKFKIESWQNSAFSLKTKKSKAPDQLTENNIVKCNQYSELCDNQARSKSPSISDSEDLNDSTFCTTCGQNHNPTGSHLYFYLDIPDKDLLCGLCEHPLVDPLDTRCGHTYCAPCLKNHLAVQALCPFDHEIINFLECQQASNIVKRLLDKLPVYCPNSMQTDSCKEVLSRCDLETHLGLWCRAVRVSCPNLRLGCKWHGQRDELSAHRSICEMMNPHVELPTTNSTTTTTTTTNNSSSCSTAISNGKKQEMLSTSHTHSPPSFHTQQRQPCDNINITTTKQHVTRLTTHNSKQQVHDDEAPSKIMTTTYPHDGGDCVAQRKAQIIPGEISAITIDRRQSHELGISIVGGIDTPLLYIMIQEIYLDSIVAHDGRLHPGDQILEINEVDLTKVNHLFARHVFMSSPKDQPVRLLVYRERVVDGDSVSPANKTISSCGNDRGEIITLTLVKRPDKKLGIKIAGKKNRPGLYVLGLVSDGIAHLDGRIKRDDRILDINGHDLCEGRQEEAVNIITLSEDRIRITVLRTHARPHTPTESMIPATTTTTAITPDNRRPQSTGRVTTTNRSLTPSTGSNGSCQDDIEKVRLLNAPSSSTISEHHQQTHHCPTSATNAFRNMMMNDACKCLEKYVQIEKSITESLGMSVAGGLESQRGDTPVYVTGLAPNMAVSQSGQVMLGNILLGVNNENLCGLTHEAAVDILKSCRRSPQSPQQKHVITLHLYQNCIEDEHFEDAFSENGNFMPSWIFWLHLPRFCQLAKSITLTRTLNGGRSLGFSVVGGSETTTMSSPNSSSSAATASPLFFNSSSSSAVGPPGIHQPIVVKTIVPNSPAHIDGRLKCGDLILEVNGISLVDVSHSRAVTILKSSGSSGQVTTTLKIVSWPGTIV